MVMVTAMESEGAESVREGTMWMRTVKSETSHEFRTLPFPSDVKRKFYITPHTIEKVRR
ncbi:MAG: hypothetical protein J7J28_02540 [Thaumarchaeota archaeon]|nr:hypothetical protein [Nitrososphaerota archaeon]